MSSSALSFNRFLFMLRSTKRWWMPLIVLTGVGVNVAGLFLPRKYQSQAVVFIRETIEGISSIPREMLKIEDRLKTIKQELISPDFLRSVAARENLDAGIPPDTPRYQKLLQKMADSIELQVKDESYLTIAYRAGTPEQARNVTRAIVDQFIRISDEFYSARARSVENLIETQLKEATAQLKVSQDAVIQYQRDHFNEIPQAQESHLKSLNELAIQKQTDINNLIGAQEKLALARKRLEKMDPNVPTLAVGTQGGSTLSRMREEKNALEMKRNLLLRDFTPAHPLVVDTEAQLAELSTKITEMQGNSTQNETAIPNRDYVDLQNQIAQWELDERRLKGNIEQQDRTIAQLNTFLSNIPKLKLPLDQLESDRRLKEEQVNQLAKKLYETKVAVEIEKTGLGPTFEITSYPPLPMIPSSPNRKKLAVLSVFLALAAGMGLVYLLTIFDTTVRSVEEVRAVLQMPLLGVVQRIITPGEELLLRHRRRRRVLAAAVALTLLLAVLTVGLLFFRGPIEQSLETVRNFVNQW